MHQLYEILDKEANFANIDLVGSELFGYLKPNLMKKRSKHT